MVINKMDKFTNLTVPIMRQQLSLASLAVLPAGDHRILCRIYRNVCKELKVIQGANVAPQLGKYLHDIIPRERRTTEDKNKGVFFRKIIKLCNSYLDYLIMIGEAITGDMDTTSDRQKIMKVLAYQVN